MDAQQKVDNYIDQFPDWRGKMLAELRAIINTAAPDAKEEYKWNCPVWTKGKLLLAISGFKNHVKINFFHGSSFPDQRFFNSGLDSKDHRSIDFKESDKIDPKVITDLVLTAVKLDQQ